MGKNRKKPRNKGVKNRRYGRWSNQSTNTGSTTPGTLQVGLAAYRERAASLGKPEAPLRHSRDEAAARARYMENEILRHHIRELWTSHNRTGSNVYYQIVYREIKFHYKLSLMFSGHNFIWMLEDWRCSKKKFSIVYHDKARAEHALECGWEEGTRFGITWKTEVPLS